MSRVRDTRIVGYEPGLAQAALLDELPLTAAEAETVERTRAEVRALLDGADGRLLDRHRTRFLITTRRQRSTTPPALSSSVTGTPTTC